jgi:hypothetical protein
VSFCCRQHNFSRMNVVSCVWPWLTLIPWGTCWRDDFQPGQHLHNCKWHCIPTLDSPNASSSVILSMTMTACVIHWIMMHRTWLNLYVLNSCTFFESQHHILNKGYATMLLLQGNLYIYHINIIDSLEEALSQFSLGSYSLL